MGKGLSWFCCALLLAFPACTAKGEREHHDADLGVSLIVPDGWQVEEIGGGFEVVSTADNADAGVAISMPEGLARVGAPATALDKYVADAFAPSRLVSVTAAAPDSFGGNLGARAAVQLNAGDTTEVYYVLEYTLWVVDVADRRLLIASYWRLGATKVQPLLVEGVNSILAAIQFE